MNHQIEASSAVALLQSMTIYPNDKILDIQVSLVFQSSTLAMRHES